MSDTPEWFKEYWENSLKLSSTQAKVIEELEAMLEARTGECDAKATIIKELEAKLAKAVEALEKVRAFVRDLASYADQGHALVPALHDACTTLAELKGAK